MPEGDTIFRVARTLHSALAGERVILFETAYAALASVNDNAPVAGRTIERVESRGKWLLMHFTGDLILVTHMLMSGSWHIYRRDERWRRARSHMRVVIETEHWQAVAFDVPLAQFHTTRSLARHTTIPALGPDLLGSEFAEDNAAARIRVQAGAEVADVLLNQRVMAGIGNVFKSEICFACGVHPFRKVSTLQAEEIDCLVHTARRYLVANVSEGAGDAIATYTGARSTTGAADPGARLWVYRRQGRACRRCGESILMRKQGLGARSTYWCPQCQPMKTSDQQIAAQVEGFSFPLRRRKIRRGQM
jgi:endonuclease-8